MEKLKIEDFSELKVAPKPDVPPTKSTKMGTLQFKDTSLDVKRMILSYIIRPKDLKTLCLTSKQLRDLATPALYRNVTLDIGGPKDMLLIAGLLSRDNPGLKYIRDLSLGFERNIILSKQEIIDDSSDDGEEETAYEEFGLGARQAQLTARLLLDALPENVLESFSWQEYVPFSVDNWLLLWKKQKCLKTLEVDPTDRPFMPEIEKRTDIFQNFKNVSELYFYPNDLDGLRICQKMLESKPHATGMTLSTEAFHQTEATIPDDLQDSSTRTGLITSTLFSHLRPFSNCVPMVLKRLVLDKIELRYAADTYLRFISMSHLESLTLDQCVGAENFFSQLSKPLTRPGNLKTLRWLQEDSNGRHVLEAFEGMLEILSGLESIQVEITNVDNLPKPAAISHHGKTLKTISIHSQSNPSNVHHYDILGFADICNHCSQLKQLSVDFPPTSLNNPQPAPNFKTFLASTRVLHNLNTLVIGRWPSTSDNFTNSQGKIKRSWFELYKHNLQRLVQFIFIASDRHADAMNQGLGHRSHLSVIAIGGNGKSHYDGVKPTRLRQIPFVRGEKVGAFGEREMHAVATEWRLVQFLEPESTVLNWSRYDLASVREE